MNLRKDHYKSTRLIRDHVERECVVCVLVVVFELVVVAGPLVPLLIQQLLLLPRQRLYLSGDDVAHTYVYALCE